MITLHANQKRFINSDLVLNQPPTMCMVSYITVPIYKERQYKFVIFGLMVDDVKMHNFLKTKDGIVMIYNKLTPSIKNRIHTIMNICPVMPLHIWIIMGVYVWFMNHYKNLAGMTLKPLFTDHARNNWVVPDLKSLN